jgi:nitrate reductase gamma subunit
MNPELLFKTWPYVSIAAFAAGMILRYLLSRQRIAPRSTARPSTASRGSTLLHLGLVLLFAGHLLGLLFPRWILAWNARPARLYLLESIAFASGTAALLGWAALAFTHLTRPVKPLAADLFDAILLSLVGVTLLAGLLSAARYRWSSSWGVLTVTPYALSLLRGEPIPAFAIQLPFLARLHVATAPLALAIVPLTRLAPPLLGRIHRAAVAVDAVLSATAGAVRARLKGHNPGRFIWPDED